MAEMFSSPAVGGGTQQSGAAETSGLCTLTPSALLLLPRCFCGTFVFLIISLLTKSCCSVPDKILCFCSPCLYSRSIPLMLPWSLSLDLLSLRFFVPTRLRNLCLVAIQRPVLQSMNCNQSSSADTKEGRKACQSLGLPLKQPFEK